MINIENRTGTIYLNHLPPEDTRPSKTEHHKSRYTSGLSWLCLQIYERVDCVNKVFKRTISIVMLFAVMLTVIVVFDVP